jgi:hypothetical protein
MKLPLIRSLAIAPARAPILRYGVALLSTVLALIPTLFFSDIAGNCGRRKKWKP